MDNSGFIKIHRSILNWEWWDDIKAFRLFMYCILRANYQDTRYKGIELKRGQFLTSYESLAKGTNLTVKEVRNRLEWLRDSGELDIKRANKGHDTKGAINGSIITIINYNKFQEDTRKAVKGQNKGKQRATDNKYKELEEGKNCFSPTQSAQKKSSSFVPPTDEECEMYFDKMNYKSDPVGFYLFNNSRGWKGISDWKATADLWEHNSNKEKKDDDEQFNNGYGDMPKV